MSLKDSECIAFLQWALPRLHLRWMGFRKVRRQVCKRIQRRINELDLPCPAVYQEYLDKHTDEWSVLDRLCRITISRFYRDRGVYSFLACSILPELAQRAIKDGSDTVRIWSVGCGSGEEPYSVALLWMLDLQTRFPTLSLQILATDIDGVMLRRAQQACYANGSLKDLPQSWRNVAFEAVDQTFCLRTRFKRQVIFAQHDIRRGVPGGTFHLILCRNLVFTYFDTVLQRAILRALIDVMLPRGVLVLGIHEQLPEKTPWLETCSEKYRVYRKCP